MASNSTNWETISLGWPGNTVTNLDYDGKYFDIIEGGLKDPPTSTIIRMDKSTTMIPPNSDILINTLVYLGPQELFNMSNTCKYLRSQITLPLVIKSALMCKNGNVHKTMDVMLELMTDKSIWIPSPLRLLRLINGRRCEFCNTKKTTYIRKLFGVFACGECMSLTGENKMILKEGKLVHEWSWICNIYGNPNNSNGRIALMNPVRLHPRVTVSWDEKKFHKIKLWAGKQRDASGEMIGPLVTLAGFINVCDYVFERKSFSLIDHYLERMRVPAISEYDSFVGECSDAKEQSEKYKQDRLIKKEAAVQLRNQKIKDKATKMVKDIKALLPEGRRTLMHYTPNQHFVEYPRKTIPCICFANDTVGDILLPHAKTAAKITKKKLKELATEIEQL